MRQLLAQGLLVTPMASTARSRSREPAAAVLRGETHRAAAPRGRSAPATVTRAQGGRRREPTSSRRRPLFEALRAWRAGVAREQGVPAYIVFGDATLRALAEHRPGDASPTSTASRGIGAKKREAYGEAVLAVVAAA